MKNISSLKSLTSKALNTRLATVRMLEQQILVELDNRLFDRQQKLKTKVFGLDGLERAVALFKPITTKRAMTIINSDRGLLTKDSVKVPNLKFYLKFNLDSVEEFASFLHSKTPKIFAKDARGNVYEYRSFNNNGKLQFLGRVKA